MASVNSMQEELQTFSVLQLLTNAFIETSALKIKHIRTAFEANRGFYEEMSSVFHLVKYNAYIAKRLKSMEKKDTTDEPQKTLTVALTANHRFYGSANIETMRRFIEETETQTTDRLVIGIIGIDHLASIGYNKPFLRMQFGLDLPSYDETIQFLSIAKSYQRVVIYYTQFVSLLTQTVGVADITQSVKPDEKLPQEEIHIIFEPELPQLLEFFDTQIRMLLFLRILLESDLARTATRLITMSAAEERIQQLQRDKQIELRKAKRSRRNRELLETFAGMKQWKQR